MPWTHQLGDLLLTVCSDGPIELPVGYDFYEAKEHGAEAVARVEQLNAATAVFAQNPLIVDSPRSGRTVVDTGVGRHALLDSRRFGANSGTFVQSLEEAGVDPASVDRVLITHLHPDHAWGLIDERGEARFPNATVHLHADERDHWTSLAHVSLGMAKADALRHVGAWFALRPYGERLRCFSEGGHLAEDIEAIPAAGHTPGHVTYRFTGSAGVLLSWGDHFHHESQIEFPEISARTDCDLGTIAQRRALLERLVEDGTLVHSYHLPYPGIGRPVRTGDGFLWEPLAAQNTPAEEGATQ